MPIPMSPPQVILQILCWVSDAASLIARLSLGGLVLGTALLLAVAVYRLFLHPLSRIPGPRLAAVTNCWLAYHVRNGHMLRLGKTLHAEYGPAVRVGPNEVWFNTKDAFRLIYSKGPCHCIVLHCFVMSPHLLGTPCLSLVLRVSLQRHELNLEQVLPMAMKSHPSIVRHTTSAFASSPPRIAGSGAADVMSNAAPLLQWPRSFSSPSWTRASASSRLIRSTSLPSAT